tara:strand:+ start:574 stop:768 length:195 start_codon:yes stop_codon:yes gene_type:complete
MVILTKMVCDRCGQETDRAALQSSRFRRKILHDGDRDIDLCEPCYVSFQKWKKAVLNPDEREAK